jgi:cell division transport system ATP-binding protein
MVDFKNVSKIYPDDIVALSGVTLKIEPKEFAFIVGPSGAGKSTMLRLLIREEYPTQGEIFFEDVDVVNIPRKLIAIYRQQMGVTFQDLKLVESRTARENIEFALEITNKPKEKMEETVEYLLDLVNLKDRANLRPCQLSGGEKQKVAIARALANEPKLLIADEPTGNLDPSSALEILDILKTINSLDTTVVVITHDHDIVNKMQTRVISLEKGKIISDKKGGYTYTKEDKKVVEEKPTEQKEVEIKEIQKLNLSKELEKKLLEKDIDDFDKLFALSEEDLKEMGVNKKDIDELSDAIAKFKKQGEKPKKEEKKTKVKKTKKKKEIEDLKLSKELEEKLVKNKFDNFDKLLDLTEAQIKKIGLTQKELEEITDSIMKLNKLRK